MARSFLGFGQLAYIGSPALAPIKFKGIAGLAVPLLFNWLSYGAASAKPNVNVLVNLNTADIINRFGQLRSIYIDNLGSDVPIYVNCPDTSYAVVAKPNSAGWYPIYTNTFILEVIGLGFIDNDVPTTRLLITNLAIEPSTDDEITTSISLWRASRTISRGSTIYNSDLGVPALGDQSVQPDISLTGLNTAPIFQVQSSGFYYISSYYAYTYAINNAAAKALSVAFESTGVAGVLFSFQFAGFNQALGPVCVAAQNGLNLKIDATQTWQLRNTDTLTAGAFVCFVGFTYNPN